MTRFLITLEKGVETVWQSFQDMIGGEIYIPKIPSIKIIDLAEMIAPNNKLKFIGIRPGEKLHEEMISSDDAPQTYEYKSFYKILPLINDWNFSKKRIKNGIKVVEGFSYTSDNNKEWMNKRQILEWIELNKDKKQ